jgi:hypothetical protein
MKEPAEPAPPGTTSVPAALLEYFGAPGKYQLTLRQPGVLFSSVREILQLASDRGAADAPQSAHLREAANFFIRAALLYPGADHYAVLGLAPGETPPDLKERYRLLMRLIHPDFAGAGSAAWPPDAAVRVNRAYEVLSSAVLRREYDEQLAAPRTQRPAAAKSAFQAPVARRVEEPERRLGKKAAVAFGLAFGIPAVLLLMPRSEPDQLVQRQAPAASAPRALPASTEVALARPPDLASTEVPAEVSPAASAAPAPAPASASAPASAPVVAAAPERTLPATPHAPLPPASLAPREAPPSLVRPPAAAPAMAQAMPPAAGARAAPPGRVAQASVQAPVPAAAVRPVEPLAGPLAASPPPAPVVPDPPAAAPAAAPAPAPILASVSTTPAAVMLTAAPSTPPAAKLTTTLSAPVAAPTLADAQPLLTQVLQMLESGSGDQLLRLLDGDARKQPGAQALSRQYEQLVHGGRPIRVSQVDFQGEPRDGGVLLVTGRIRLHAGEPTIGSFGQKLVVRAEFAQRAGKVHLTGLSSAPE